jgi:rod shape determining protein RodA
MNWILTKVVSRNSTININFRIVSPIILLCLLSLFLLNSTSAESSFSTSTFSRQLLWLLIGVFVFICAQFLRIQFFNEYAYHFYVILVIAILGTYFMPIKGGSQRWLIFGPLSIQPSEVGKVLMVFVLAKFLSDQRDNANHLGILISTIVLVIFPALLVFNQPDLGTSIIYLVITYPMLYWVGIRPYYLFIVISPVLSVLAAFNIIVFYLWMLLIILLFLFSQPRVLEGVFLFIVNVSCGLLTPYIWENILYEHQRNRILTFLDPLRDPQGSGYQIIQSMTAIGSGGFWGTGLGQGTQTHLRYLPVRDTDFIISVSGEELGLFSILFILASYSFFIFWMLVYAEKIRNIFSSLVMIGFVSILFVHLLVNMGMIVGLFPVTGLPAPFISYGGSFLLTCILMVGLINNITNNEI